MVFLGATVTRLTPDQKVACSNHVGVKIILPFLAFKLELDFGKEDHGLYSSVDPSSAVSGALSLGGRSFAWTLGTLIWFLWTPKVNKIPLKKLGKIQIFDFFVHKNAHSSGPTWPKWAKF